VKQRVDLDAILNPGLPRRNIRPVAHRCEGEPYSPASDTSFRIPNEQNSSVESAGDPVNDEGPRTC
jgi:hypothetical protein